MRRVGFLITAVLLAGPAFAQTAQEQAAEVMTADMVTEGFAPEVSETVAECFVSRMSDAEAEAFLAADGLEAQQDAVAAMADNLQAVLCVAEALDG